MIIAVAGLWHLGCVTAACLGEYGFSVLGYDPDAHVTENLKNNQAPIFEPGLTDLLKKHQEKKLLSFTNHLQDLKDADILWVNYDTPVDENDHANCDYVINQIKNMIPYLKKDAIILISSQLPLGSTQKIQHYLDTQYPEKNICAAYSPENLRLGKGIDSFTKPDRIVVGVKHEHAKKLLAKMLAPISANILWMSVPSAEMTKHALNAFLASSVVFINEIAVICENYGANAKEVEQGLKSEVRIGPKAYLKPGSAFAGGTLARDLRYLEKLAAEKNLSLNLFSAVIKSNEQHHRWLYQRIQSVMMNLNKKNIAVLGLAYKPQTDTLRRSKSIELCEWLNQNGAVVSAYDFNIKSLSTELKSFIRLTENVDDALRGADAVVIANESQGFKDLSAEKMLSLMKQPIIFDPSSLLEKNLLSHSNIQYFTVGTST